MKKKAEIAVNKFKEGYNCAQSVFYSFCDDLNIKKDTALKIACGFGGGMARKQEVCGAVTGGIMVLGAKLGRGEKDEPEIMSENYKKVRELLDLFEKKHGTYICRNLLNDCNLYTQEGQQRFKENDLKNKICIPCVQSVVEILEEIL